MIILTVHPCFMALSALHLGAPWGQRPWLFLILVYLVRTQCLVSHGWLDLYLVSGWMYEQFYGTGTGNHRKGAMVHNRLIVRKRRDIYRRRNPNTTHLFVWVWNSEWAFPRSQQNERRALDRPPTDTACHFYPNVTWVSDPRKLGEWGISQWQTVIS